MPTAITTSPSSNTASGSASLRTCRRACAPPRPALPSSRGRAASGSTARPCRRPAISISPNRSSGPAVRGDDVEKAATCGLSTRLAICMPVAWGRRSGWLRPAAASAQPLRSRTRATMNRSGARRGRERDVEVVASESTDVTSPRARSVPRLAEVAVVRAVAVTYGHAPLPRRLDRRQGSCRARRTARRPPRAPRRTRRPTRP